MELFRGLVQQFQHTLMAFRVCMGQGIVQDYQLPLPLAFGEDFAQRYPNEDVQLLPGAVGEEVRVHLSVSVTDSYSFRRESVAELDLGVVFASDALECFGYALAYGDDQVLHRWYPLQSLSDLVEFVQGFGQVLLPLRICQAIIHQFPLLALFSLNACAVRRLTASACQPEG